MFHTQTRFHRLSCIPTPGSANIFAPTRDLIHQQGRPGTGGRPRPVFMDADVAFIFVTHTDICHVGAGNSKEMTDWTATLERQWERLINHALLFPRAVIICGGPASTMGWSDYRYKQYTDECIALSNESGVLAFDCRDYFEKMEMGYDGWHWASTDENRAIFVSMIREVAYMLSLTVLPQPWKVQQVSHGGALGPGQLRR